jgi:hypothetical protein
MAGISFLPIALNKVGSHKNVQVKEEPDGIQTKKVKKTEREV